MNQETLHEFISTCRSYMIKQLQKEVPDYLYEKQVLTEKEYQEIISHETREIQIACLLDKLPGKESEKCHIFMQYIADWYSWVLDRYRSMLGADNNPFLCLPDVLDAGEIPPLPSRIVKRKEYMVLNNCLCNLQRNEYVVVHGMRGCGKSTLVTQVLRGSPAIAVQYCTEKVFWLPIGRDNEELTVLQELFSKLWSRNYNVPALPLDSKSAKRIIRDRLRCDEYKDCLVILDDVSSSSFVEALDICCKILITTDDKNIMKKTHKPVYYVKVSEGFTEKETLELFSMSIGSGKLPPQAKTIHDICKGFPLTISLLSSQLAEYKEDVIRNTYRWDTYLNKLKYEGIDAAIGRFDQYRSDQITLLYKAIGMSINSLIPELKGFYQTLAVFMNDVNIKPEVLCTLWGLGKKEVEDIMGEFEKKSLIIKAWNRVKNSYIYCVHDLLLDYLKKQLSECEKKESHLSLIRKYQSKYGDDVNNFPVDDNYILLYLGYHLKEANLEDEFARVYLNLIFVEKKIRNYGAADLLLDFKRYKPFIVKDGENNKKYEDFVYFITRVAACISTSSSNIIQFGLFESKESAVYECAMKLVQRDKGSHSINKYFQLLTEVPKEHAPPFVYYNRQQIVAATFTDDKDVIIANTFGEIRRINVYGNNTVKKFAGHSERVTSLQLAKNKLYFLSASDDATVGIWCVNGNSCSESQNRYEKPRTPSPQMKQHNWQDFWPNQRHPGEAAVLVLKQHRAPIKCAQFSNSGSQVVTAAADCQVIIWSLAVEKTSADLKLLKIGSKAIPTNETIESCSFSHDDTLILCATREGIIFTYDSISGDEICSVSAGMVLKSMIVIPENPDVAVFILGENQFQVRNILEKDGRVDSKSITFSCTLSRRRNEHYICAAVSWDGKYIAIASATNCIYVYDMTIDKKILKFNECNGIVRDLCWSRQNDLLLASYHSDILKIWDVQNNRILNSSVKLHSSIFDAAWISDQDVNEEGLLITAALDNTNKINVYYDLKLTETFTAELSDVNICHLCVCPTSGDIIYVCEKGRVYLANLDTKAVRRILNDDCVRVCKIKMFSCENKLLLVLLVERNDNLFVLHGWRRSLSSADVLDENKIKYEERCLGDTIYDYIADLNNGSLYVIQYDHVVKVYNANSGAYERMIKLDSNYEIAKVKYCDISANSSFIATGNDNKVYLRTITNGRRVSVLDVKDSDPKMCKFSTNEKYLAIGCSNGVVNVYETEFPRSPIFSIGNAEKYKFATIPEIDVIWSPTSSRFIVIFDKEISLYEIRTANEAELLAVLYMSVDKLVCNHSFSKSVTVDKSGHFRVLQHPS